MRDWAFWEAMATDCDEGEEKRLRKKFKFMDVDEEWKEDGRGRDGEVV